MVHRFVRPALAALLALAAMPAVARTHHNTASTHRVTAKHGSHATPKHGTHPAKGKAKPAVHRDASPAGVTSVPAGGLKVYCPARKSPLLIRKATQGSGTTVTVVCR